MNFVPNLNIPKFTGSDNLHEHVIGDSVQSILYKYRNHSSIIKIKERRESSEKFIFSFVSENEIGKLLRNLNARKASQKSDIPTKQSSLKYLKKFCMIKFRPILLIFYLKINVVSVKLIAPNIIWWL